MKKINLMLMFFATLTLSLSSFGQGQLEIIKSMGEGSLFLRYNGTAGNLAKATPRYVNELIFEKKRD